MKERDYVIATNLRTAYHMADAIRRMISVGDIGVPKDEWVMVYQTVNKWIERLGKMTERK